VNKDYLFAASRFDEVRLFLFHRLTSKSLVH
jgi:hypothetical protein